MKLFYRAGQEPLTSYRVHRLIGELRHGQIVRRRQAELLRRGVERFNGPAPLHSNGQVQRVRQVVGGVVLFECNPGGPADRKGSCTEPLSAADGRLYP